jgi:hypothetical protein
MTAHECRSIAAKTLAPARMAEVCLSQTGVLDRSSPIGVHSLDTQLPQPQSDIRVIDPARQSQHRGPSSPPTRHPRRANRIRNT